MLIRSHAGNNRRQHKKYKCNEWYHHCHRQVIIRYTVNCTQSMIALQFGIWWQNGKIVKVFRIGNRARYSKSTWSGTKTLSGWFCQNHPDLGCQSEGHSLGKLVTPDSGWPLSKCHWELLILVGLAFHSLTLPVSPTNIIHSIGEGGNCGKCGDSLKNLITTE